MKGDFHARICEGLWVKLPRSTRFDQNKFKRSMNRVVIPSKIYVSKVDGLSAFYSSPYLVLGKNSKPDNFWETRAVGQQSFWQRSLV